MDILSIIERKKNKKPLSIEDIQYFTDAYNSGEIPDYQMSALLMAIVLNGMNAEETANLTMAMLKTGKTVDLSGIQGFVVDKHSTGGVGDKTSLIVLPCASACGLKVAKLSGRSLGFTGGTIDKLESIPGFRTNLNLEEFTGNVNRIGIAISAQTSELAPVDRNLYALRDVTGTVDSIPLIASSIMSKKLASGAHGIVLDVKTGSGAFMKTREEALSLAETMVSIGKAARRKVIALVSRMDRPLGNAVGNSLEVIEALEVLKGKGPQELITLCTAIVSAMLEVAGRGSREECDKTAKNVLINGAGLEKFKEMVEAQGGDVSYIEDPRKFVCSEYKASLPAKESGIILRMDTEQIGRASMMLGAGRMKKDDIIDHSAGIVFTRKTGDHVNKGDEIAKLYTSDRELLEMPLRLLSESIHITNPESPDADEPVIYSIIRDNLRC